MQGELYIGKIIHVRQEHNICKAAIVGGHASDHYWANIQRFVLETDTVWLRDVTDWHEIEQCPELLQRRQELSNSS